MRIYDIEVYRDGGSIEFRVERDGKTKHVWLETPFKGESRALLIDSVAVSKGSSEVSRLMENIEEWWKSLPPELQSRALEAIAHKGGHFNPNAELKEGITVSRVLYVRDYIAKNLTPGS